MVRCPLSDCPTPWLDRATACDEFGLTLWRQLLSWKGAQDLAQHSKRFRALTEKVKTTGLVAVPDAVRILKNFNTTKFNQTVEVSTHLGIDPKQTDQNVRGSVALPHGIGKIGPRGRLRPGR